MAENSDLHEGENLEKSGPMQFDVSDLTQISYVRYFLTYASPLQIHQGRKGTKE